MGYFLRDILRDIFIIIYVYKCLNQQGFNNFILQEFEAKEIKKLFHLYVGDDRSNILISPINAILPNLSKKVLCQT